MHGRMEIIISPGTPFDKFSEFMYPVFSTAKTASFSFF